MAFKKPGIFVTGTDTGVGKTVVSAGIAMALRARGIRVGVMKPVATGCVGIQDRLVSHDAAYLMEAAENEFPALTNPVRYRQPLSPNVAASIEKREVNIDQIRKAYRELQSYYDFIIVEGVGGLLVPLTQDYYVANMIREFNLPLVVVSRCGLGTINHTLLTLDAAIVRGFDVKGIIFNRMPTTNISIAEMTNPKVIHELTGVPVLGCLPEMESLSVEVCEFGHLQTIFQERIQIDRLLPDSF
ncbi:MAG: dethiobiotin synthase [Candidatus Omnitrophica bacterium]|nr:dethiobiotin synthase [Candidatus Omnitrophota bacterium]